MPYDTFAAGAESTGIGEAGSEVSAGGGVVPLLRIASMPPIVPEIEPAMVTNNSPD